VNSFRSVLRAIFRGAGCGDTILTAMRLIPGRQAE
jgi:hypothetical protein